MAQLEHKAAADRVDRETLPMAKFTDPRHTATGEPRAQVALSGLRTLWLNTGTLCNLACANCYIESSPRNDRLAYLSTEEVVGYLDEIEHEGLGTEEIGITGGEPFMNPDLPAILRACLERGHWVLLLTNAMRPMMKQAEALLALRALAAERLTLRVSLDHYGPAVHEAERGPRSWAPAIAGLRWLTEAGFHVTIASRQLSGESDAALRAGFAHFFAEHALPMDANDPRDLVIFPEMDEGADVPEITEACWGLLGRRPEQVMCAESRMVVKRKGATHPVVVPCTLLPYDTRFELGETLRDSAGPVALNHPHCARFCVLGGASCGAG
ncbi:radical SAM protein [Aquibaculum arenosum]|uniref:Radical SAM protein n=1 Tax=Aquibaculum arenosum TaxID=3032591 RepID=A0ABT5YLI1_9PROT|nr:radical SAM protein [Fodinicurvata sp. CAU 1616]MDF2095729.1 radical SAM protein [Fodinicurvata sp. CAU 1616]